MADEEVYILETKQTNMIHDVVSPMQIRKVACRISQIYQFSSCLSLQCQQP